MNKPELIARIAEIAQFTKVDTKLFLESFFIAIEEALGEGCDKIRLGSLGTLKVVDRQERQIRNVRTKEMQTVPAHRTVIFTASDNLKELVNEGDEPDDLDPVDGNE